jgi:hypothetical protein
MLTRTRPSRYFELPVGSLESSQGPGGQSCAIPGLMLDSHASNTRVLIYPRSKTLVTVAEQPYLTAAVGCDTQNLQTWHKIAALKGQLMPCHQGF